MNPKHDPNSGVHYTQEKIWKFVLNFFLAEKLDIKSYKNDSEQHSILLRKQNLWFLDDQAITMTNV